MASEDRAEASDPSLSRNLSSSRLNAKAAEFVPRSAEFVYHKAPGSGYFPAQAHVRGNQRGFTQQYVPVVQYHQPQQAPQPLVQAVSAKKSAGDGTKTEITDEATQKLINQVLVFVCCYGFCCVIRFFVLISNCLIRVCCDYLIAFVI